MSNKEKFLKDKEFREQLDLLRGALKREAQESLDYYDWTKEVKCEEERRESLREKLKPIFGSDLKLTK